MKHIVALLCALSFSALSSVASASTPTQASVEKLLSASGAEKISESLQQQVDGMMKSVVNQTIQGRAPTPEEQKVLDAFREKCVALAKDAVSFDKLKKSYVQIYTESFTQEEIDQLTAFYQSPTGKAFVAKMPIVMQKSMELMQQLMPPMMQQMKAAAKEMQEQLNALKQKQPDQ